MYLRVVADLTQDHVNERHFSSDNHCSPIDLYSTITNREVCDIMTSLLFKLEGSYLNLHLAGKKVRNNLYTLSRARIAESVK
jgi:uncharacterized membrane protein YfhO